MKKKNIGTMTDKQRKFVEENLEFAYKLAHCYKGIGEANGVEEDDLKQEASLGLCFAAMKYKKAFNVQFESFSFYWCRRFIESALAHKSTLPTISPQDSAIYGSLIDEAAEEHEQTETMFIKLDGVLDTLEDIEQRVIRSAYGVDCDMLGMKQIARKLHITLDHAWKIYQSAMDKLIPQNAEQAA